MRKKKNSIAAFSLVEVTIALGIVVFCLVTILGLLAVGANSTHTSTVQTSAINILAAVASDVEAGPNITPSYSPATAKGTVNSGARGVKLTTPLYGIQLPVGGSGTTTFSQIYIGDNGQVVATAAAALYQLNVWLKPSTTTQQETYARMLISWPAQVSVFNATGTTFQTAPQGYIEDVVAINRT